MRVFEAKYGIDGFELPDFIIDADQSTDDRVAFKFIDGPFAGEWIRFDNIETEDRDGDMHLIYSYESSVGTADPELEKISQNMMLAVLFDAIERVEMEGDLEIED